MRFFLLFLTFIFGSIRPALADAGVPMLMVTWPLMIVSLIPIIIIEIWVFRRFTKLSWKKGWRYIGLANLFSTLVGIPLTWLVLVGLEVSVGLSGLVVLEFLRNNKAPLTLWEKALAIIGQAPWLVPYESELHWMIPTASLILLIPFFFVSWWVERGVLQRLWRIDAPSYPVMNRACFYANLASYLFLAAVTTFLYFRLS